MEDNNKLQVWSCGGGVQSSAIAALIASGRIAPPDVAVIADTGYEKSTTWKYVEGVLQPALQGKVVIHRVLASKYATVGLYGGKNKDTALIPAFTNKNGTIGKMSGFCSTEWKVRVIKRWLVENFPNQKKFNFWMGISTDEMRRAKEGDSKYSKTYPLINQGMSRESCIALVESIGWPTPPRSSCWMCPNQTQDEWRDLKENNREDFDKAVAFDVAIRKKDPNIFLHADATPIGEADFSDQNGVLFGHDCSSGHCFV